MASYLTLGIYAADRNFFTGLCKKLVVPVKDGYREILVNHEPMFVAVDTGSMTVIKDDGSSMEVVVGLGSLQVVRNQVTILVETAEYPWEIDIRRAEEAKARAEEELRQRHSREEYEASQAALARALSRLRVVRDVDHI